MLKSALKTALYRTPWARYVAPRYSSCFRPADLGFLVQCLEVTRKVNGSVVEIGCFAGATTLWLNQHMTVAGIEKPYFAIDTFDGFLPRDIEYEVSRRGKSEKEFEAFRPNRREWFDETMRLNGVERVKSIKTDAVTFDYSSLGPISFALIDVDLYLPVQAAMTGLYPALAPGGIIVLDDCRPAQSFDGALEAYQDFVISNQLRRDIYLDRLGIIQR